MSNLVIVSYMYISDLLKIFLIVWGVLNYSLIKKKRIYLILVACVCVLLPVLAAQYTVHTNQVLVISAAMVIVTSCVIFQGRPFRLLAHTLLAYIVVFLLDGIAVAVVTMISNSTLWKLEDTVFNNLIINSINLPIIGLLVLLIRRVRKSKITLHISKRIYALLFTGAATGSFVLCGLMVRQLNGTSELARKMIIVVLIVVVIAYCTACIMMIAISESRDNYRTLSLINQSVIEAQQKYYMLVNEKQQEIRSIRHEMKNHLACINALYHSGKDRELAEYLLQLEDEIRRPQELFSTGNDIVDAILNDALSKYKKDRIDIQVSGGFPEVLYINSLDLCVIVANTVTNAAEAILRMQRREDESSIIKIKISSFKDDIYIDVSNPVDKEIVIKSGEFVTSKEDKALHGFGIKNVRQRVEKYHGTVNYRCEEGIFYAEINIKNKI